MRKILLLLVSILPYPVKNILYRLFGYKIGKKVKIGFFTIIDLGRSSQIGTGCKIGSLSYVQADHFNMGSHSQIASLTYIKTPKVSIGKDVKISSLATIRSGHLSMDSELIVGDLVHIFPFVNIDCSRKVEIQREAGIGPYCDIYTHASYKSILEGYPVIYGDVNIGERVELTYRVFVAPGVTIGNDAICAYGSYVNKDVPTGVLAAGLPALVKRTQKQLTENRVHQDIKELLEGIIEEYVQTVHMLNGRDPLAVFLCMSEKVTISQSNAIYLLYDSHVIEAGITDYAMFDISSQRCSYRGVASADFWAFRKFMSRYGIRFVTITDSEL